MTLADKLEEALKEKLQDPQHSQSFAQGARWALEFITNTLYVNTTLEEAQRTIEKNKLSEEQKQEIRNKYKTYKKGTKIRLYCCTHDVQSKEYEDYTLDQDYTEKELEELAKDFYENTKEPEWWFEEIE